MKKFLPICSLLIIFCMAHFDAIAVIGNSTETTKRTEIDKHDGKVALKKMTKKERRAKRKEARKQIRQQIKQLKKADVSISKVLLVIIAIFIPFLAMGLYDGLSARFWISLLLTLLFYLPGLIYTLIVILGDK